MLLLLWFSSAALAAAPTFQAAGAMSAGTGARTVVWPAHAVDDVALLIVQTANQVSTLSTPAGFVEVLNSPQGTGTAGGAVATRLSVFWARATSTGMTSPVVADSGNNQVTQIITFRGVIGTGNPWDVTAGDVAAAASTSFTIPGATTAVSNALVVAIVANGFDTATSQTSGWTNASLSGLAEVTDINSAAGNGGGFGVATGVKATAGAYNATTGTLANSSVQGRMSIALKPKTTTIADGTNPANSAIAPGAAITDLDAFTLATSNGTDSITALTVTLTGANSFQSLSEVRITDSTGATTYFSAVANPASNTVSFSGGTPIPVTTTATTFKVRITPKTHANMPVPPGLSYAVGGTVTAFTSTNEQSGTDSASATVTVDNLSPLGATAVSGSAGDAKTTLNWTTSSSSDFAATSGSVVYRWAAASAGAEVPAEGSTPALGSVNGTATVACMVSSAASTPLTRIDGTGGSADCTTTALINGQPYTYKIFQKDTSGNYDVGVLMGTITPRVTALGDGTNPSNVTIAPSAAITDLDSFTLSTSAGTDSVTALTVTLTGANSFQSLSEVRITSSDGLTTYFSAVANPASNTVSFSGGTPIPVTTTATTFKVRITPKTHANMPVPPGLSYAVGGTVTAFTSTNGQSGTDSASATVTVDNLSPLGATATSGSPGDMQVTLNWTTSASTDFSRSVVLRWTGGAAGTEVPAEGTNYVNGNTITTATVVCVRTADAASTAVSGVDGAGTGGCSATPLTSGQAYTYKVFQKDSNGNYDVGVAVGAFTTLPRVLSINRLDADPTSAATVRWTVTFSMSVTGVDATAFSLVASGLSGAYITTVTGSGTTWTVTANTGIGSGTLGLNQTGPGSVVPTLSGTFTGQVYTITATPALAEYRMDEASWNGTANEVVDSSGSGNHAQAFNSANTEDVSRAIPGSPGTCRNGVFDNGTTITQGYVQTPLPNLTTDFTVTAWIRTTNNTIGAQRILIDDQGSAPATGYGLSLAEGGVGKLRFYSRGITPIILDSTYTIANNTWYFVAAVADITNKKRTIYVFDASGALLASTSDAAAFTGAWGTDGGPVSIGAETNASAETPAANHFKGNLDEVRVYQKVLSQNALAAIATQTHVCPINIPDHIRIEHDGSAISCSAEAVVVKACANAACSSLYTGGVTGNLTAGSNSVAFSIPSGQSQATVNIHLPSNSALADPQTVRLGTSSVLPVPTNAGSPYCSINAGAANNTTACDVSVYKAGFLFDVPHLTSGTASGTVNVSAVRSSDSSTCVPLFQNVTRTVSFWGEYQNPVSGTLPLQVNGSNIETTATPAYTSTYLLVFSATGVATLTSVRYDDVGLMRLNARYVGSTGNTPPDGGMIVLGSDTFVVKPDHFDLSGIQQTAVPNLVNQAAADATGNRFVMAGEQFTVTVTVKNALGNTTKNYGKETAAESVKLTSALVSGLGLTNNPAVSGTFGAFTDGVATGTAFTWNEVGIIKLTPSVGDGDYLGAGDVSGTQTGNVGRFYAAKFALSGGVIANRTGLTGCAAPAGCGTFTYMGEQMSAVFALTAKAADGTTTLQNYNWSATPANRFAKIDPTAAVTSGTGGPLGMGAVNSAATRTPFSPCGVTPAHPCLTPAQAAGTFASGVADITVPLTIYRDNAAAAGPYAVLDIGVAPQDSDGVVMAVYDLDTVNVVAGANNHAKVGQTEARYGRMKLSNAHGSELLPLSINVTAQYWDATTYVTNTLDNNSTFAATDVIFSNYQKNLNATNYPNSGATIVTPASVVFVNGVASYKLAKPGAGNNGSVDMTVSALSAYLPSNTARATFGVYKGNNEFIYLRENY